MSNDRKQEARLARIKELERTAPPAAPISSNKRHYAIGERGRYVYWLVQHETDLERRALDVAKYTARYRLTEAEQVDLAKSLADLDARRAQPKPEPKPLDPYWSLWGKLKARLERDRDVRDEIEEYEEPGVNLFDQIAGEIESEYRAERNTLLLPLRRLPVEYDGIHLEINGRRKAVKGDTHAVNALRKIDTDDSYFESL